MYWDKENFAFLDYFFKFYAVWCPKKAVRAKQAKIIWNETPSVQIANDFWHAQSLFFLNKSDTSWKYPAKIFVRMSIFDRNNIYRSVIIEVNLEVLRSRHIKMTAFRSRCCFFVRHEKRTGKLAVCQQSIYCVKNARNAASRKHCFSGKFSAGKDSQVHYNNFELVCLVLLLEYLWFYLIFFKSSCFPYVVLQYKGLDGV